MDLIFPFDIHKSFLKFSSLMESANFKAVWISIKRNLISVIFPTITILAIYADLKHTARWKRQLAEQQEK